jgi:hypothetical protein
MPSKHTRQAFFHPVNIQSTPYGIIDTVKNYGTRSLCARGDVSTGLSFPFVVISQRGRQHLLGKNAVDTSERPMRLIVPGAVGHWRESEKQGSLVELIVLCLGAIC